MLGRYGDMEFEYSPLTLLCRGGREGFVLSESLVSNVVSNYLYEKINPCYTRV